MQLILKVCKLPPLLQLIAALLIGVMVGVVNAQTKAPEKSAAELLLERAEKAMGMEQLKALQFIAQGSAGAIGQSFEPGKPWPKWKFTGYALLADYEHSALREEIVRQRTESTGGPAGLGEQRLVNFYREQSAWHMLGPISVPTPSMVQERKAALWSTAHGALWAARRNISQLQIQGGKALVFTQPAEFHVTVLLNVKFQVQEVRITVPHSVLGDTLVVNSFSDYQTFGATPYPTRIRQTWGGYPSLDLTVQQVQTNPTFVISTPERAKEAPERVTAEPLATGVWLLAGGMHHSVAIEMQDHVVLVDSPVSQERAKAIVAEVAKRIPNKKISWVVNTHPHFDTVGGIRNVAAQGADVIAAESSRTFFERVWAGSHHLAPDAMAQSTAKPKLVGVIDKYLHPDEQRKVEIFTIQGATHAKGMLMVYLPAEKLLIQSDAYTPGPPFSAPPETPQAGHLNLLSNIERLRLDVERIVPLRGRVVYLADLYKAVGR